MGKASMCIQMLQTLNTGRTFKASELAEILDTPPRNIAWYKEELDEIPGDRGFFVESIPGRYGGYRLRGDVCLPALKLLPDEKDALKEAFNYVYSKKDFVKKKELARAFAKVLSNVEITDKENDLLVVDHYQLAMSEENIRERYEFVEEAIERKRRIEIEYDSLKKGRYTCKLEPYKLLIYNNAWFFLAWSMEAGGVRTFKLNRMVSWKMTEERFVVWEGFKAENYFDENGFKTGGGFVHVELIASGSRKQLIQERVYGKNQVVTPMDDDHIRVSLDMANDDFLLYFMLSSGEDIKILEPQWLIDKLCQTCQGMIAKYQ